jgi:hypothetical protein
VSNTKVFDGLILRDSARSDVVSKASCGLVECLRIKDGRPSPGGTSLLGESAATGGDSCRNLSADAGNEYGFGYGFGLGSVLFARAPDDSV